MEEELWRSAPHGPAGGLRCVPDDGIEVAWPVEAAKGGGGHAVVRPGGIDEPAAVGVWGQSRAPVARGAEARELDEGLGRWRECRVGASPCGSDIPPRTGGRRTSLHRVAQEHRQ